MSDADTADQAAVKHGSKKWRRIAAVVGLVVVAGAACGGYRLLNSTASGTITQSPAPQSGSATDNRMITVNTPYASFAYPATFTKTAADPPVAPVLLVYDFTKQQLGAWHCAIQVSRLASGSLNDDGSYNYRRLTSDRFTLSTKEVKGASISIFTDNSTASFDKVAFLQRGTLDVSIALSGGNGTDNDQLSATLDKLIAGWRWH